jgi:hypothetical protein
MASLPLAGWFQVLAGARDHRRSCFVAEGGGKGQSAAAYFAAGQLQGKQDSANTLSPLNHKNALGYLVPACAWTTDRQRRPGSAI